MAEKRKKVVLTIKQKLEIINRSEEGESVSKLASVYGIGAQTVRDIKSNKDKLLEFVSKSDNVEGPSKRKSMKISTYEKLDDAMIRWFNQKQAEGTLVSGPMCVQQAKYFHKALGLEGEFRASSGWLTRFKGRYSINKLAARRERLKSNIAVADSFCSDFQKFAIEENLMPDQIYNADETGLYWKSLPTETLLVESDSSYKSAKERVTVMCCGNAAGNHKLKLVVIGNEKIQPSFNSGREANWPVHYYNEKGAWMTKEIFKNWFDNHFIPEVRTFLQNRGLPQKAILLLDSAPSHPEDILKSDDSFFVKYLPPNTTSLVQPMNQGVIASMKQHYRIGLLKTLAEEDDWIVFWKEMILVDAVHGVDKAWSTVSPVTLVQSWRKLLPALEQYFVGFHMTDAEDVSNPDLIKLMQGLDGFEKLNNDSLVKWFESDAGEPGYQHMSDEDIVTAVLGDGEENDESDGEADSRLVSHSTALRCLDTLLDYMGQQGFEYSEIVTTRKIRAAIRKNLNMSAKHDKICD